VDQYRFEGRTDGNERGFFSLLQGGLRTITGLVGRSNKRNYQVQTRVATIGIRGTEYQLKLTDSLSGSVGEGEVGVCNAGGCVGVASGQSFFVLNPSTQPSLTAVRTSFPPPQPGPLQSPKGAGEQGGTAAAPPPITVDRIQRRRSGDRDAPPGDIVVPPRSPGRGHALAYARDNGPDRIGAIVTGVINNSTATFDSSGQLISYVGPSRIDLRQPASVSGARSDDIISWGTWTGSFLDADVRYMLQENQGMHYVIGKPAPTPALLHGSATYTLLGATPATGTDNGQQGTLGSATTLWLDFASRSVNLSMQVNYGADSYNVDTRTSKQPMTLNRGFASFEGGRLTTTGCAAGNCETEIRGIIVGQTAERAGFAYQINDTLGGTAAPSPLSIHGAAALTRQPDLVD
jgi:hypothetical protein